MNLVVAGGVILNDGAPIEKISQFLRAIELRGLSPKTIRAYRYDLFALYRWFAESKKNLDDLSQADLLDFICWLRNQKAAPKTINRRLSVVQIFYRFCFEKEMPLGIRASAPAPYYMGPGRDHFLGIWKARRRSRLQLRVKVPRTIVEPLTVGEVKLFLESVSRYRDVALVLLLLLCGLRSSETLALELTDVDFFENRIRVHGKGNKERILPLPSNLVIAMQKYLRFERPHSTLTKQFFVCLQGKHRGAPMTITGLRSIFRHRRIALKLERANPHRFRHTFGADMARSGVRLPVLQRMMGHANGTTTLQYIYLSMSDIADEYQRVMANIQARYEPQS